MKFTEFFNDIVAEGFKREHAMLACAMLAIHLEEKPTMKDLISKGSFAKRVEKKFKSVFWEESPSDFNVALKLWKVYSDYSLSKDFDGLGGNKKKSIRSLFKGSDS